MSRATSPDRHDAPAVTSPGLARPPSTDLGQLQAQLNALQCAFTSLQLDQPRAATAADPAAESHWTVRDRHEATALRNILAATSFDDARRVAQQRLDVLLAAGRFGWGYATRLAAYRDARALGLPASEPDAAATSGQ